MTKIDKFSGKTHTMLGPNPRKVVGTPTSTNAEFPPKTAISVQTQSTDGGLMVKAMDEIFRHVEQSDNPESFKVIKISYNVIYRILIYTHFFALSKFNHPDYQINPPHSIENTNIMHGDSTNEKNEFITSA